MQLAHCFGPFYLFLFNIWNISNDPIYLNMGIKALINTIIFP